MYWNAIFFRYESVIRLREFLFSMHMRCSFTFFAVCFFITYSTLVRHLLNITPIINNTKYSYVQFIFAWIYAYFMSDFCN